MGAQAAWAASGGPEKARDRLPEGRTKESPKELTGRDRHKDGAVDKAKEHKSLGRIPEYGLGASSSVLGWPGTSVLGDTYNSEK